MVTGIVATTIIVLAAIFTHQTEFLLAILTGLVGHGTGYLHGRSVSDAK